MNNSEVKNDVFWQKILQAADSLRNKELENAFKQIVEAICLDPDAPHPHNLLGIYYELSENGNLARRHYRAAYSLDPTFKPACINLERICMDFGNRPTTYDFGDVPSEEPDAHNETKQFNYRRT